MKRGTPRHPKMYALAEALTIPLPYAVGILEMLWHHAAQHTPRGDIGSIPDAAIKEACCSPRKQPLIDSLVISKWIHRTEDEHRLYLHDWPDHCEQSVVKLLESRRQDFLPVYGKSLADRKKISRDSLPSREALALDKDLDSENLILVKKDDQTVRAEFDDQWQLFREIYASTGKPLIEKDFTKAHYMWRILDLEQRTLALANLSARKTHHDPQFIPNPSKYLYDGEYKRSVLPRPANGNGRLTVADRIDKAFEAL